MLKLVQHDNPATNHMPSIFKPIFKSTKRIFRQLGRNILKAIEYFFKGLWFLVKPIVKPKGRNKVRVALALIFIMIALTGFTSYPKAWDKATNWLNPQLDRVGFLSWINLPNWHNWPFQLGLDLQGGTHLVYEADTSQIKVEDISTGMQGVRDVIERRINIFGVKEPLIQIESTPKHHRLIVELAGIQNTSQAIQMIGQTPSLDFREERPAEDTQQILALQQQGQYLYEDPYFQPTDLTGKNLKKAQLIFDQNTGQPKVGLEFDSEGTKLFADLTKKNIGKRIGIYLDQTPISAPNVNEEIPSGQAEISGNFTTEEARILVQRLNAGALPVPIQLVSQQTVGPSLGKVSLGASLRAAFFGLMVIMIFLIVFYRLSGLLASASLLIYGAILLSIFKLIPVTLTLSGIAGFVLSLGMAVDANILIFERQKEEVKQGKNFGESFKQGFKRAWPSIRDGNITTLITCAILYLIGTGMIKGFALTLGLGILINMFTAMVINKKFIQWLEGTRLSKYNWLFNRK